MPANTVMNLSTSPVFVSRAAHQVPASLRGWRLWARWVVANALGEWIGLAIPAVTAGVVVRGMSSAEAGPGVAGAGMIIAAGALEGWVVGFAQWLVLRHVFHALRARAWVGATMLAATLAWTLGMLPSALLQHGDPAPAAAAAWTLEPIKYFLAAGMGAVLGALLAVPQWRILRHHVHRSVCWIPANAVAWAAGMPIVFAVAGGFPTGTSLGTIVGTVSLALVATGATVGAIHGVALVWLVSRREPASGAAVTAPSRPARPGLPACLRVQ